MDEYNFKNLRPNFGLLLTLVFLISILNSIECVEKKVNFKWLKRLLNLKFVAQA